MTSSGVTRPRSDGVSRRMPYSRSPSACATRNASSASSRKVSTRTMRGTSGGMWRSNASAARDRVAEDEHQRMGHRARRAEPGQSCAGRRRGAHAATDDRRVVERVGHSGWTWRAPNETIGSGAAASTHSRAAVAQPVDWAIMPEQRGLVQAEGAVARANAQHHFLGLDRSPSHSASTVASPARRPRSGRGRAEPWPRRCRTAPRRAGRRPPSPRPDRGSPRRGSPRRVRSRRRPTRRTGSRVTASAGGDGVAADRVATRCLGLGHGAECGRV